YRRRVRRPHAADRLARVQDRRVRSGRRAPGRARPPRRARVRRDERGLSPARARRAGRRVSRGGRGLEPRPGPARRLCTDQGSGQGRLRDRSARRGGEPSPRGAAGTRRARGIEVPHPLRLPDGVRDGGPRGAARRAPARDLRRARRARSAAHGVRRHRARRRAGRGRDILTIRAPHGRHAAGPSMTAGASGAAARRPGSHPAGGPGADVLLPVPGEPTVSFSISFAAGSQDDPPGKEGLAYLTGLMLAEAATERHSYEEILAALYPLASAYGVRVDKERTTLTGRTHLDNVDRYVPLLTDAYLRPAFDRRDFERLKSDAINDIENTLRYASDEELAKAALDA